MHCQARGAKVPVSMFVLLSSNYHYLMMRGVAQTFCRSLHRTAGSMQETGSKWCNDVFLARCPVLTGIMGHYEFNGIVEVLLNLLVSEQNTQTSESIADTDSHGADHFNIFNVCSHHDHHASCDWIRRRIPRFIEILDLACGFLSWPGDICENQEVDEYVIHFLF